MYNLATPYFFPEDVTEILKNIKTILDGGAMMTMGENVNKFEKEFAQYIGCKQAIATNSCTSALEISLRSIGLSTDDEVIVPAQTFIATGSCVVMTGGRPIFCDTNDNFLLSFKDLKEKITKKTKAVIIVHFAGLIHPEIFEMKNFLNEKGIILIEDAAHAPGAKIGDVYAGNIGDFGCFSFFSTKIMTTGEGGMLTVNNEKAHSLCASIRNRGLDYAADNEIFSNIGSNRRVSEIHALLGRNQIKRLPEFLRHRHQISKIYLGILKPLSDKGSVRFQDYPEKCKHAYWRFVVFLEEAKISAGELKRKMKEANINIDAPYSPLLHLQPVFKKMYGNKDGMLKNVERLSKKYFCLPLHYGIKESDAVFIAEKLKELLG